MSRALLGTVGMVALVCFTAYLLALALKHRRKSRGSWAMIAGPAVLLVVLAFGALSSACEVVFRIVLEPESAIVTVTKATSGSSWPITSSPTGGARGPVNWTNASFAEFPNQEFQFSGAKYPWRQGDEVQLTVYRIGDRVVAYDVGH